MRAVVAFVAIVAARAAMAQPSPGDADERAKDADRSARAHYHLRQYAAAIDDYRRAFEALPDPLFLFDIAQAYRQLHDCDNALAFYRRYLHERPDADNRAKVEQFIDQLSPCSTSHDVPPEPTPPSPIESPTPLPATPPTTPPPTTLSSTKARAFELAGVATAALGAGIVGAGIYFSFQAQSYASQLEAACAGGCSGSAVADIDRAGQSANNEAIVSFVIGGAVLATGASVFAWAFLHAPGDAPVITPVPGGATVSARFTF